MFGATTRVDVCVQCKEIEKKLNIYRRNVGRSLINIPDSVDGEWTPRNFILQCIFVAMLFDQVASGKIINDRNLTERTFLFFSLGVL